MEYKKQNEQRETNTENKGEVGEGMGEKNGIKSTPMSTEKRTESLNHCIIHLKLIEHCA